MTDENTSLFPVAHAKTDFPQKFGIPKQPLMVENLYAELHFKKEFSRPEFFEGLEKGQAIWAIFLFHLHGSYLKATIRPPALGGKVRHGIFSTRSPHRPNPIGLSLLIFENLNYEKSGAIMKVKGADFTDGTPILDIKPYLSDFDRPNDLSTAPLHWAQKKQKPPLIIKWDELALNSLNNLAMTEHKKLIEDILKLDPRPTSQRDQADKIFYQDFKNLCLQWQVKEETLLVISVEKNF